MLWGMISSIQMILHSFLLNIRLPSNAQLLCSKFMLIASFNVIPTDLILDKMFDLKQDEPPTYNYEALGYNSISLFHNLGTIFFILMAHLILAAFILTVLRCKDENESLKRVYNMTKDYVYGGAFLRFFMESYLQVAISVFLAVRVLNKENWGEKFQTCYTFVLCLMMLMIPFIHFFFLRRNKDKLDCDKFIREYGPVYRGI